MAKAPTTIYILYNANASLLGKLDYSLRKLRAAPENSPCSACDLTHGGLRLTETKEWAAIKEQIPATVKQLHRDELDQDVSEASSRNQDLRADFRAASNLHFAERSQVSYRARPAWLWPFASSATVRRPYTCVKGSHCISEPSI